MSKIRLKYLSFVLISSILAGCAASKNVSKIPAEAELAYSSGDYQKTLQVCEATIESKIAAGKEANGNIYNLAGIAAAQLQQDDKAIGYFDKAKYQQAENDQTYLLLAAIYLRKDNLSKEISNLELYKEKYSTGSDIAKVNNQLFSAYVRSENWELGDSLWTELDSIAKQSAEGLTNRLIIKRKLKQEAESEHIATQLIKLDKTNTEALEFFADMYYNRADNTYITEMKAYEKNKTMKQYNRLTAKLKEVNADFKKARDYYETLYKLKPQKRYAKNLGNIYSRFDNKTKANYYYRLSK